MGNIVKYARTKIISKFKLDSDGKCYLVLCDQVENVTWKYVAMKNENRLKGFKLVALVFWQYLEMWCRGYH